MPASDICGLGRAVQAQAHVRKSVGSIPTDCSFLVLFFLFCFSGLMSRMENCVGPEIEPYPVGAQVGHNPKVASSILDPRTPAFCAWMNSGMIRADFESMGE